MAQVEEPVDSDGAAVDYITNLIELSKNKGE
jgi:hypothetical protein